MLLCLVACLTLCDRDEKPEHKRVPSATTVETEASDDEGLSADEEAESGSSDSSQSSKPSASASTGSGSGSGNGSASKPSTGSSGTSSSSGSSSSSKPSSGSSGSSTADKPKEKVWVVDVPAVYEREPIYEGGYDGYWVKLKDGTILKFGTGAIGAQECLEYVENNAGLVSRYGSGLPAEIVGYREVCVQEEQGHWECR